MQNFTNYYVDYGERGNTDIYFIFGNANNITASGFQGEAKTVSIASGNSQILITSSTGSFTGSFDPNGSTLTLSIEQSQYVFNLNAGENFYFVLTQDFDGAEYVLTG